MDDLNITNQNQFINNLNKKIISTEKIFYPVLNIANNIPQDDVMTQDNDMNDVQINLNNQNQNKPSNSQSNNKQPDSTLLAYIETIKNQDSKNNNDNNSSDINTKSLDTFLEGENPDDNNHDDDIMVTRG